MKKSSIVSSSMSYISLMIIITAFSLSYFWIYKEYLDFSKKESSLKNEFTDIEKNILKNEIDRIIDYIQLKKSQSKNILENEVKNRTNEAYSLAKRIYTLGKNKNLTDKEIQTNIIETLRVLRYNGDRGYFFIVTLDGIELLYPAATEFENKNVLNLQDDSGHFVIQEEIKLIKEKNEGFITGHWKKPIENSNEIYDKISFIKKFEPYNWYIGTGEYLDVIEKNIQKDTSEYISSIRFGLQKNQYIFVTSHDGIELINGMHPEIIGKNIFDLENSDNLESIRDGLELAKKENSVYIDQIWYNVDSKGTSKKLTYLYNFKDWKWIIGSGISMDIIENQILDTKTKLIKDIKIKILNIFFISFAILTLNAIFLRAITIQIKKNFELFLKFFKRALKSYEEIDIDAVRYIEFKDLAFQANLMINDKKKVDKEIEDINKNLHKALLDRNGKLENISKNIDKLIEAKNQNTIVDHTKDEND